MVVGRTLAFVASAAGARIAGPELATPVIAGRQIIVRAVEAFAQRRSSGRCFRIGIVRVTVAIGRECEPHNRDRKESRHYDLTHRCPLSAQPPSRERDIFRRYQHSLLFNNATYGCQEILVINVTTFIVPGFAAC